MTDITTRENITIRITMTDDRHITLTDITISSQTDDRQRHHDHRPEFRFYVNKMTDTTITDEHHRPMTRHHDQLTDR